MNEKSKKIIVIIVCAVLVMCACFYSGVVFAGWRIKNNYISAVAKLTDRITELEETNQSLERINSELADTNQRLEESNLRIQNLLSELGGSIGKAEDLSGETEITAEQLQSSLTGAEETSDRIIGYLIELAELCGSAGE